MKRFAAIALGSLLAAAGTACAADPPARHLPSDSEIAQILAQRIDVEHRGVGIVVGVIDADGRRVVAHGAMDQNDPRAPDGDTLFEIGSITKVFTSLILADMVQRGEVALDDPAGKFLPPEVVLPERGGKQITLIDLATHTSGLPRMPSNFWPKDPANPFADYTVDDLYRFLDAYILPRDIGNQVEYSNLGVGLLGHVLARRAGTDYEALVRERITAPLGMTSTVITLTPELKARLAPGHDQSLQRVANWDLPTLAGAGALRSTANDLLIFLAAELGQTDTALKPTMAAQLVPRRPIGTKGGEIALGWGIATSESGTVVSHSGGTGGYRTFIGFDPGARIGVVVLTNTTTDPDDIGFHLLNGAPLAPSPALDQAEHHEVSVDVSVLERYLGQYQFAPGAIMTITRQDDRLFTQLTGQPASELFPESPTDFFSKIVDAQVRFEIGPDGRPTGLVLHQNGRDQPAPRLQSRAGAAAATEHHQIALDAATLERYVGRYQLTRELTLTITREGSQLFAQRSGHGAYEIYPEGPQDFFWEVTDAQVSFRIGRDGRASGLVVHRDGRDTTGIRLD